jgi:hypothetical protein
MDLDPSQYSEADRRAVDPPIQVEMATCPRPASSTGGSWSVGSGSGGYAVRTAGNAGLGLVICGLWTAQRHNLSSTHERFREIVVSFVASATIELLVG